jgi:RNA polymerase sigma factor (sigma-70 family)
MVDERETHVPAVRGSHAYGSHTDASRVLAAVWRSESARIVAGLARFTSDFALAEDVAQDAVAAALAQWPTEGVPERPGAWLTTVAKRRAVDLFRRNDALAERYALIAGGLDGASAQDPATVVDGSVDDDVLRLVFVACHPVLSREARIALTLRVVAGLSSEEIARAFVVPTATVQQRIVRAKKTLTAARVPFESPSSADFPDRLADVLEVVYLVFSEGYAATAGEKWVRADLAGEAIRLGRLVARLVPRDAEALGLVALMELQASRFEARTSASGDVILLDDQDRRLWNGAAIARGLDALDRSDRLVGARGRGPYALQAAIAACHSRAQEPGDTDWPGIVTLYDALLALRPSPVVALNRAVAVSKAIGPATALRIVDDLVGDGRLDRYAPRTACSGA